MKNATQTQIKEAENNMRISSIETISKDELKALYRRLSKMHHPDLGGEFASHERMCQINEAYAILAQLAPEEVEIELVDDEDDDEIGNLEDLEIWEDAA